VTFITWFAEASAEGVENVGGKGANLGELTSAGFSVPPGFIVKTAGYWELLAGDGLLARISECLARLQDGDRASHAPVAGEIKEAVENAQVPPQLRAEIQSACTNLGEGPFAVRSSATAEDLAEASFAGQQATLLNVRQADVLAAVRICWASLFEPHAISYRASRGIDHLGTGMAVVVQKMVQAARSGVMFTVHPVTGDKGKIVIEAAYGLGEAIVSGIVTPDTYIVDKDSLVIEEKDVNRQERKLVMNPGYNPGEDANTWLDVPAAEAAAQKLADPDIASLADLGSRIEAHYRAPQDIEWAERDGSFFILQARPVTAGI
jgi:pyruvate,water dikinase